MWLSFIELNLGNAYKLKYPLKIKKSLGKGDFFVSKTKSILETLMLSF